MKFGNEIGGIFRLIIQIAVRATALIFIGREAERCSDYKPSATAKNGFIVLLIFLFLASVGFPQTGNYYNPKDDQYTLLGLRRAKEVFELAKSELENSQQLFDKKLIAKLDLDRAKTTYSDAEVNYQQALLSVLFERQYVSIKSAVKFRSKDGEKSVRLLLENSSGSAEFEKLVNVDDALFRSLQPDVVNNIYVSLLNDDNAIISKPYEIKIDKLFTGHPKEIQFELLQDVDAVSVNLIYGNGTQSTRKIYLQKDASVDKVLVQSEQFSQEAELGGSATFTLSLELFSGRDNTFKLEVVNLPRQINRNFFDPSSNARISQFKFTESANTRGAALKINLPDRPGETIAIDQPMTFYALVIPRDQSAELGNMQSRQWTQEEIEALNCGYARLELIPRGVGELLVRAPQLYKSIKKDELAEFTIDLVNDGTRRLDNVEIEVDPPLRWQKEISPINVPVIEIGEEARASIVLTPPDDIAVGRYEIRVRTSSLSNNQPIAGEDKTITVEILPESNIFGTIVILLLIIGLVTGIVVFGVRLSKK